MYQVDPQQASAGPTPSQSQHTEPQEEEEEGSPGPSPSALLGNGSASVHGKRKQPDSTTSDASGKKRRQRMGGGSVSAAGPGVDDGEEAQDLEVGPNGGAKHWTEEEKTRFFTWMLTSDEHWDAFRTRMNTVFREVRVLRFLPALPPLSMFTDAEIHLGVSARTSYFREGRAIRHSRVAIIGTWRCSSRFMRFRSSQPTTSVNSRPRTRMWNSPRSTPCLKLRAWLA